ncbi:MAG: hypothetical protein LC798_05500 [Chloroflexi bacterium]|nr:hypothetical protein [Chloroflexota bacterium]
MTVPSLSTFGPSSRSAQVFLALAAVTLLVILVFGIFAPDVLAAPAKGGGGSGGAGNDVGTNLGEFLRDQAIPIYAGVIAIVSILFLLNRRYSELGLFVLMAFVVGWLVFSPTSVGDAAKSIGDRIFG